MTEPATTNRIMFFMITCSIFNLLFTVFGQLVTVLGESSSVFFLPVHMRTTFVQSQFLELFLSGSQSCSAKIQLPLAAFVLVFALEPFRLLSLRWVYFRETDISPLDQSGQSVDRRLVVIENGH